MNAFASKAATNAVIASTPVMIYDFFDDCTFRSSFSDFWKLINAFHFIPRNNGRGGLASGLAWGLASVKSGPHGTTVWSFAHLPLGLSDRNSSTTEDRLSIIFLVLVEFCDRAVDAGVFSICGSKAKSPFPFKRISRNRCHTFYFAAGCTTDYISGRWRSNPLATLAITRGGKF